MLRRFRRENYLASWAAVGIALGLASCSERKECDKALDIVCSCASKPCAANPPPPIVGILQRCDNDEIIGSYHLPICISDNARATYCRILDGLTTRSMDTCLVTCSEDTACDLEAPCHDFQRDVCGVPVRDGGPDARE